MISFTLIILLLGCFIVYLTSSEVSIETNIFYKKWIHEQPKIAKIIGLTLLIIGLFTSISFFGRTSGILCWLFLVTLIMSLLIILFPLKKISIKHLSLFLIIVFLIELTSFY